MAADLEKEQLGEALELLGKALEVEYRLIFFFPRLLAYMPDEESRHALTTLGEDSVRHAGIVASAIERLGGEKVIPTIEPLPQPLDIAQLCRRQLEYERMALTLHRRAAEVVGPPLAEDLRWIAHQEEWHIELVEDILHRLPPPGVAPHNSQGRQTGG